ncbi:DNA cytosine methyltransferase [Bacteroides sp.]|uniref:DNA cytosine methyltransferase n=1 Tax=Bacteroides sp. TaxID=29523 RepID=UPI002FC65CCD
MEKGKFLMADLFAGCGGLSLGLEQAGFTPWFANEINPQFCNTYKFNHDLPDANYFVGDINNLNKRLSDYEDLLGDITIVCGGPPCQGFSMANRQRLINDKRNNLYKAYIYFLSKVRPKFFIMENVRGMAKRSDEIKQDFKDFLGNEYQYDCAILNAQDYGIPQNRERFFFIGNRMGIDVKRIFDEIIKQKRDPFVLRDVLFGLPKLGNKEKKGAKNIENSISGFTEIEYTYIRNEFYSFINGDNEINKLYNHKNRYNNSRDIEIFGMLPQGANSLHPSIQDIMPYSSRNHIFKDKYFKLDESKVSKTITAHMKFDCHMYIHPWEARGLSPREAARVQTFPDNYIFTGSQNLWYAQIGNAVPVKLSEAIGNAIMKFL